MSPSFKITRKGASATDSRALEARIESYARYAHGEVNTLLDQEFSHLGSDTSLRILDLGCGSGRQSLHLAAMFPCSRIFSVDASAESVEKVRTVQSANIYVEQGNFDDSDLWDRIKAKGPYDVIVSFYSIYYAKDLRAALEHACEVLAIHGKMLLVGFASGNNREINLLTERLTGASIRTEDFLDLILISDVFGTGVVRRSLFENSLEFPDYDALASYYRNYGLYHPAVDHYLAEHFEELADVGGFVWSKSSLVITYQHAYTPMNLPSPLTSDHMELGEYERFLNRLRKDGFHPHS